MSCLPEIFIRSNYLPPPSKIGGRFSVNLRSTSFSNAKQAASVSDMRSTHKTSRSLEGQRYSARPLRQDSMRASKTGRSFHQPCRQESLEQHGHGCENLNGRTTHQSEVEAASNFNAIKRQALESMHLARRILQLVQGEANTVRNQINTLNQGLTVELDTFKETFLQQSANLIKQFRIQRRALLEDNKTITQQLSYLSEEVSTSHQVSGDLLGRFEGVIAQFI